MKDTWTLNQCVSTLMEVFLNQERINVCEDIYSLLIDKDLRECCIISVRFLCALFFIPLGPKYLPQDPVFKSLSLDSSLNVRDHVSQPYSTIGNTIVLYILTSKNIIFFQSEFI